MEIIVTNITTPFSFFCILKENYKVNNITVLEIDRGMCKKIIESMDICHGQYIVVMWKNKWVRGVIIMESQLLIWLLDFGIYIRPHDDMIYTNLPKEYQNNPSRVFEASVHGVMPVDKVLSVDCEIKNSISTSWNKGSVQFAKELIKSANKTIFVPVAILSTKYNDIVIGDLYLEINGHTINLVKELEKWPVFVQRNSYRYVQNLKTLYTSHRRHRECHLKPDLVNTTLPNVTVDVGYEHYKTICDNVECYESDVSSYFQNSSKDVATIVTLGINVCVNGYKLSMAEIAKYSTMSITVAGVQHNALQLLLHKIKDLKMCERYKNLTSVGRACSRRTTILCDLRNHQ